MALPTASRALRRSGFGRRLGEDAGRGYRPDSPFALDPIAHLRAGHVLIPGILGPDDDEEAGDQIVETGAGAIVRFRPMIFDPFDHQVEMAHAWVDVERLRRTTERGDPELRFRNIHAEKSRQMGDTWLLAWVLLWALTYHRFSGLAIHRDGSKVDDGGNSSTVESIFGRIRYMAESRLRDGGTTWPESIRPREILRFRGGNTGSRIFNRLSGSFVSGATATPDPGRGGTYDAILVDEAARLPWGRAAQSALVSAAPTGRAYVSTPEGEDNLFYDLREPRRAGMLYLRHHWSDHPVYAEGLHVAGTLDGCVRCEGNREGRPWDPADLDSAHRYPGRITSPWYDRMVVELVTDERIAKELDISYERSLEARVYPEFSEDTHVIDVGLDPYRSIEFSWDFGIGTTAVGIWQEYDDAYVKVGEVEMHDARPEEVASAIRETLADLGMPLGSLRPEITSQMLSVGDPSGGNRERDAGSYFSDYRRLGFSIVAQRQSIARTIFAVKRGLMGSPKPLRYSRLGTPETIRHIKANRWPTDRLGNRKQGAREPENDAHNHMMRADAYLIAWKFPPPDDLAAGAGSEYLWPDPADQPYTRVSSYEDVPAGPDDPYSGVL